ncbi:MAG: calcium-binding protein, partial [Ilumatobacteraceae bacterium]
MGGTFGHVVIDAERASSGDDDLLRFTNVRSTDITATREGSDLILTVNGTNEQIRVVAEFTGIKPGLFGGNLNGKMGVQQIVFSDGVVWDKSDIATAASHPRPDLAVLTGTDDHDVLDGGVGGDTTLIGGDGGDTYIFGVGYGHDTVDDQQNWIFNDDPDIVKFKSGITLDDLQFFRDGNSNDLNIFIKGTTDELAILGQFAVYYNLWNSETNRIELFEFSDGTSLSWENVIQTMDAQGWGQPAIYGFSYADTLDGGPGVHYLSGGNEDDTYTFDVGYTYDVVADAMSNIFAGDNDTIQFGAGVRPQDVTFSLLQGSREDLAITLSDGSTMIVKREFAKDIFNISWNRIENFEFADGTILTYDQVRQQLLSAAKTTGNDVITSTDYADVLDGGAGNDYLAGSTGDATYVFGHGYGHDTIDAHGGIVSFNADVSLGDITWSKIGTDLVIKLNGTNDSLNILDGFNSANINAFRFADGTVLSRDDVQALLTQGTDQLVTVANGNNNLVYHRGDGFEKIVVNKAGGDVDTLTLADIASTEVSLLRWAGRGLNDLVIEIDGLNGSPQGQITIASEFDYGYTDAFQTQVNAANAPIQQIVFSDGVVWTEADIEAKLLAQQNAQAGPGAAIYGFDGADTLYAGKGARTLSGGLGNDTYVWSAGDGPTVIDDHGPVSL